MSGFWDSELGEVTGKQEDAFAKQFTHVPDGTMSLAKIESFVNDAYQGMSFLSITWVLTDGDFRGAKVTQKLKVIDADPRDKEPAKTRHRGLNMLKLIHVLFNIKPKHSDIPTDQDLALFTGRIAGIKIRETAPNDQGKQYNWVSEIHDAKGFVCETGMGITPSKKNRVESALNRNASKTEEDLDDDVPF